MISGRIGVLASGLTLAVMWGPRLVIEFSPQGVGGDLTMHVHTMYRDLANDYGTALTAAQ